MLFVIFSRLQSSEKVYTGVHKVFPHLTHTNTDLGHLPIILFCIRSHQRASTGCHTYTHAERDRQRRERGGGLGLGGEAEELNVTEHTENQWFYSGFLNNGILWLLSPEDGHKKGTCGFHIVESHRVCTAAQSYSTRLRDTCAGVGSSLRHVHLQFKIPIERHTNISRENIPSVHHVP